MHLGALTLVAMQTTGALQDQIHRRQVGEHEIEVDIQALLSHLGGDQQGLGRPLAALAETRQHGLFLLAALIRREARMKQQQRHRISQLGLEFQVKTLRAIHGIDDQRPATALLYQLRGLGDQAADVFRHGLQMNRRQWPRVARTASHATRVGQQEARVTQLGAVSGPRPRRAARHHGAERAKSRSSAPPNCPSP